MHKDRDTRFIQVRAAKVENHTSCLGDQVWRHALGVGLRSGARLGTRPSFIKSRGGFLVGYKAGILVGLHRMSPSRITGEF
jgi:hypothetical protein